MLQAPKIHLYASNVTDRASFARFIGELLEDYFEHPEEWENVTIPEFLEAIQSYSLEIKKQYRNEGMPQNLEEEKPSWRHFADILLGARINELEI